VVGGTAVAVAVAVGGAVAVRVGTPVAVAATGVAGVRVVGMKTLTDESLPHPASASVSDKAMTNVALRRPLLLLLR
jgi:hypothetical protein